MEKFVVPFWGYKNHSDEKYFIGNAFIAYPNMLITAGHNIKGKYGKNFSQFGIVFEHKEYILKEPIHIEYDEKKTGDNIKDLAIWDVSYIEELNKYEQYKLCKKDITDTSLNYFIYAYDEDSALNDNPIIQVSVFIKEPKYSITCIHENKYGKIKNCFEIKETIKSGYSGSPIVHDDFVYGMAINSLTQITRGGGYGYQNARFIKSSYISKIIENSK